MPAPTKTAAKAVAAIKSAPVKSAPAEPTTFTWDLPPAEVAEYTRTPTTVDYEALTPAPIKSRVKAAFRAREAEPAWFVQECGTKERAEEFLRLARRYAKSLDYTLRGGINPRQATQVRYSVRPFEARPRKAKESATK
jgi:hypothetical protein